MNRRLFGGLLAALPFFRPAVAEPASPFAGHIRMAVSFTEAERLALRREWDDFARQERIFHHRPAPIADERPAPAGWDELENVR